MDVELLGVTDSQLVVPKILALKESRYLRPSKTFVFGSFAWRLC